jgi:anti-sigma regulatory factor (Ser/Thr protein kinase)
MARLNLEAVTHWITAAALRRPEELDLELAARTGVGRRTARRTLARLVELQWLVREGSTRRPAWRPGVLRQVVQRYTLDGLAEDLPWALDFAPNLALSPNLRRLVQHTFTELLNNAIDHSGGTQVAVSIRQTASHVQMLVSDNGVGLFERISQTFAIATPALAMLEISKGKLTSQPDRHTGEGLFFASRLADVFDLHANDSAFQRRAWDERGWRAQNGLRHRPAGTSVYAAFALDTQRTLDDVRRAYSVAEGDTFGAAFERTSVPLRLIATPDEGLESRAQARRVGSRLGAFRRAEIDFGGVPSVGHAFADELFRVLAPQRPGVELVPVNMNAGVAAVVTSVQRGAPN